MQKAFDFFVSHASEDKLDVALPLARALAERGYRVWIDTGELTVGDRLLKEVNRGLAQARYGIVVLSWAFFSKDWPQWELEGLAARENSEGRKIILPVWHGMTLPQIAEVAPTLAGRIGTNTTKGIPGVVDDLIRAVTEAGREFAPEALAASGVPGVNELLEREPLDWYADAEDSLELGHVASARISAAMQGFATRVNAFNAANQAIAAKGQRLGPKLLRAQINSVIPAFQDYAAALDNDGRRLAESVGAGLLAVSRGLVLDVSDSRQQNRARWSVWLRAIEAKAGQSRQVQANALKTIDGLGRHTGDFNRARQLLRRRIEEFVTQHDRVIEDIHEARRLLGEDDSG